MKTFLQSIGILTEAEIESALHMGESRRIKKHDFFIRKGQVCREVAFVHTGFFRSFYHNQAGDEITYCYTFKGAFATAYSSFITQERSPECVQAMTDAEVFVIARHELLRLEESRPNWLRLGKLMAEMEYLKMERRLFGLLNESAEARYRDLMTQHPEYLQQIPLHQLASYLGITQRHLSRIRKLLMN